MAELSDHQGGNTYTNHADGSAQVGVQAGVVHTLHSYHGRREATPEEKFADGVAYLKGSVPGEARRLLNEAVAQGYDTSEAYFYRALALLSGRSLRELSNDDLAALETCRKYPLSAVQDEWTDGLRTIDQLIGSTEKPDADLTVTLDGLPPVQRHHIVQHLRLVVTGATQNSLWRRACQQAAGDQLAGDRIDRVWMFFEPDPARPRIWERRQNMTTGADRARAIAGTALFGVTFGYLGLLVIQHGRFGSIAALALTAAACWAAAFYGVRWRVRVLRRHERDGELRAFDAPGTTSPRKGFTAQVDRYFRDYAWRYVPRDTDRESWLSETAGIRRMLRDEIVDVYRESRIAAPRVKWLVRRRIQTLKESWQSEALWRYRTELRTPMMWRALCVLGAAAVPLGGWWTVPAALAERPFHALAALLLSLVGAWSALTKWTEIVLEGRRIQDDQIAREERERDGWAGYQRWTTRLAARPSDTEMASWLDCDRKMVMDRTIQVFRLRPSDVIAHAIIEGPAGSCQKARYQNGPWRYDRYRLIVFLLTEEGVRQVTASLEFTDGDHTIQGQMNYRFDAIASVRVSHLPRQGRDFELTLFNGKPIQVTVAESEPEPMPDADPVADAELAVELTADASGLTNTLHVLQGIAAEGKTWISHENRRGRERRERPRGGASDGLRSDTG